MLFELWACYFGLFFFGLGIVKIFCKLFSGKAYVEITPTYIRIDNFDKVLWNDITGVTEFANSMTGQSLLGLEVKNVSKYKLTLWQKMNKAFKFSPFYISTMLLSKTDSEMLQDILEKRLPDCKFKTEFLC